jgi:hypothetical protein
MAKRRPKKFKVRWWHLLGAYITAKVIIGFIKSRPAPSSYSSGPVEGETMQQFLNRQPSPPAGTKVPDVIGK